MPVTLQQYLSDALRDGNATFCLRVRRNDRQDIVLTIMHETVETRAFVVDGDFVFDVTKGKDGD